LSDVVSGCREIVAAPGRLDALGDDRELQRMSEVRGRVDDHAILLVRLEAEHERLVELQRVDREIAQVAERREAGAEVVDRHADAEPVQVFDDAACAAWVEHHRALGDLELELMRLDRVEVEEPRDLLGERGVLKHPRRQVHRYAELLAAPLQRADVVERAMQRPLRQRTDQMARFREPDEFVGAHVAERRMPPAQQRLDADGASGPKVDLRLVIELEAVRRERRP